jgi:DNA polymerase I-like protein with 3'-5' exonuclease and polymerase domains
MARIALVETKPSRTNFESAFENEFEFDKFALCSDPTIKKVLKKDVDIEINTDDYDWIILVGADAFKYFTKNGSISDYSGKVVNDKYIPIINPAMITFKPEANKLWQESRESLIGFVTGKVKAVTYTNDKFYGIRDEDEAMAYVQAALDSPNPFVALDSETTCLWPRDGHVLGISLCYERDHGAYIESECITDAVSEKLQELWIKKTVVFHNAKFDRGMLTYHFGWEFPVYEDTMLLHYMLDENPGNHGLKQLALKWTDYGDYEKPMYDWIAEYKKTHPGVTKDNFTFDLIPFDVIKTYAAIDSVVTFLIYCKFKPAVMKNKKLLWVYENLLIEGSTFLEQVQDNGVPFDADRLRKAQRMMQDDIDEAVRKLYENPIIRKFEEAQGKEFNPGSVMQLRTLLFDFLGLQPTGKKTDAGKDSTDAEVLLELAETHPVPGLILEIRKKNKIKNTYLDKILPQLDNDSRLRTGFNLHSTTSGRLSSSGKLNMQQLPRDNTAVDKKTGAVIPGFTAAVKGCIKARPGYMIVSMDLTTAEVYIAAVLSKDKALMDVFRSGGDFHSTIAKVVFNLPCAVEDVKKLYPLQRQAAKAVTFGIMYGAGPAKIAWQVTKDARSDNPDAPEFTKAEAEAVIKDYFKRFKGLANWLAKNQEEVAKNGFTYSFFGRKRRLPNVFSSDRAIAGHTTRSGLNFLVQSTSSDVNLLAAIEMQKYINAHKLDWKIFALVHDSILAEVPIADVPEYERILTGFVQKDRGVSIPGTPIGCEFEVGLDYSLGNKEIDGPTKYDKYEAYWDAANDNNPSEEALAA